MFKLGKSQDYKWPVEVKLPTDGGGWTKETFDAQLRRLPQSRLDELRSKGEASEVSDSEICREIVVGWSGVTDGEDQVPFSPENLSRLLDIPGVAHAIVMAWIESLSGSRRKN